MEDLENKPSPPHSVDSTGAVNENGTHLEHVNKIKTHDRVPGHENYYEKDGLRTYGDGEDHDIEPKVSPMLSEFG
jgi:hypothetical protein